MAHEFPQLAFHQWLARGLDGLARAFRGDAARDAFLAGAVDVADFERRQRQVQRRQIHMYW